MSNLAEETASIEHGWVARGDKEPEDRRVPFKSPGIRRIIPILPFIARYGAHFLRNLHNKERL